jgi:hypothetical protein
MYPAPPRLSVSEARVVIRNMKRASSPPDETGLANATLVGWVAI